jgi:arginyl-tRNA synthetase
MLKDVVNELKERGIAELSEGAMCVFVEGSTVPLIVQKSDGGYGYASTDMAALKHRLNEEKAEWIIYVTDIGQAQHFDLVFAAGRKAGWLPAEDGLEVRGDQLSPISSFCSCSASSICSHPPFVIEKRKYKLVTPAGT